MKFDQSTDASQQTLFHLLNNTNVPEFVKTAQWDDAEALDKLPRWAFADPGQRNFPLDTPARAYISQAYFLDKKAALLKWYGDGYVSRVEDNLNKAAEMHGITKELNDYKQTMVKNASVEYDTHEIGEYTVAGVTMPLYQVKTAAELNDAAVLFADSVKQGMFKIAERRRAASDFVKAANALNVDELPDVICKYAGLYLVDPQNVETEIWRRSRHMPDEVATLYQDSLLKQAQDAACLDDYFNMADLALKMEKAAGLHKSRDYVHFMQDPVDRFFQIPLEKAANMIAGAVKMGHDMFKMEDLQKVSADVYKQAFGVELDPARDDLRDILPTMPLSDVALFKELSGVRAI